MSTMKTIIPNNIRATLNCRLLQRRHASSRRIYIYFLKNKARDSLEEQKLTMHDWKHSIFDCAMSRKSIKAASSRSYAKVYILHNLWNALKRKKGSDYLLKKNVVGNGSMNRKEKKEERKKRRKEKGGSVQDGCGRQRESEQHGETEGSREGKEGKELFRMGVFGKWSLNNT